jgi:hypothetical protein
MNNNDIQQQTPPEEFNIENYPKEKYITGKGEEKERYIVPDDVFEEHIKELPDYTVNESKTYMGFHGGKLKPLGLDPENDLKVRRAGAEATNAKLAQRRTFKEQIDIILASKDKENGKTGLENVTIAMYERAIAGDTKAAQFLRDTAGEKPADNIDLNANVMTEADKQLLEKLKARLN